jgi:hypothetical protein
LLRFACGCQEVFIVLNEIPVRPGARGWRADIFRRRLYDLWCCRFLLNGLWLLHLCGLLLNNGLFDRWLRLLDWWLLSNGLFDWWLLASGWANRFGSSDTFSGCKQKVFVGFD